MSSPTLRAPARPRRRARTALRVTLAGGGLLAVAGTALALGDPAPPSDPVTASAAASGEAAAAPSTDVTAPAPTVPDDPTAWETRSSFVGPYWSDDANSGTLAVLEESVTTTTSGSWSALGLVRNETGASRSDVGVVATLKAADGSTLDTVEGTLAVAALRAGEPGPFELASDVPAASVASVTWAADGAATSGTRPALDITQYPNGPIGSGARSEGEAIASAASPASAIVVAWLDADLRVIDLGSDDLTIGNQADPTGALAAGDFGDFAVAGPGGDARAMLWGVVA